MSRALAWFAACVLSVVASASLASPRVAFLYANASEGSASGGHVALRIDERVYHYQRDADGLLLLVRDAWRDFAFEYRVVGNRSLSVSELDVPEETALRLRAHFERRFIAQRAELNHLSALRDDAALFDALASPETAGFAMRGAGFFARGAPNTGALPALRERIAEAHGSEVLGQRRREAEQGLRDTARPTPARDPATPAWDAYTFSQRYADAFDALLATEVLQDSPPVARDALRVVPGELEEAERASLRARQRAIEDGLVDLVVSRRPDWGFAFLLGAARWAALAESLEGGRLVVLDVAPQGAERAPFAGEARALDAHLDWRRDRVAAARDAFFADPSDERALSSLEREAALHGELAAAAGEGALPRRLPAPLVPQGRATVRALPRPAFEAGDEAVHQALARQRLADALRARREDRDYDLIERNCATELFAQVERAVGGEVLAPLADAPFAFVPFAAERAVARSWPGEQPRTLPSRRLVAARHAGEAGWLTRLRESNTLTSTLYAPHRGDSIFLFFTDDARFARPLLGAVNLATGVVASGVGLVWAPIDRGAMLERGLRGVAASVPELAFFNIRKGTYPLALPPRGPRAVADARPSR